jgi:hypothetical protein
MEHWIVFIIIGAMCITLGPTIYHLLREERLRTFLKSQISRIRKRV